MRGRIRHGDLALCRASSIEGDLISAETGSPYTHVGMLSWVDGRLMLAETIQHRDARLISFCHDVAIWPGYYDLYRIEALWDRDFAWRFMLDSAGTPYGYRHLSRYWLRRHFSWVPPIPNSDDPRWARDCSAQVHCSFRLSGGRPLKEFDCDVSPGDLAQPGFSRYIATMYADQEQIVCSPLSTLHSPLSTLHSPL